MRSRWPLRILSAALLICLVLQDLAFAQGGAAPAWPTYKTSPRSSQRDAASLRKPQVPRSLGATRGAYLTDSDRTLIHIEDAHDSMDAQEKITSILDVLASDYDVRTIALEGGSSPFDAALFRSFPDPAGARKAARTLMEGGRLNAGEFFAATSDKKLDVYGAEEETLYRANLKSFRDLLSNRERLEPMLAGVDKTLAMLTERVYSGPVKAVSMNGALRADGGPGFTAKWGVLKGLADERGVSVSTYPQLALLDRVTAMEEGIDFKAANGERERLLEAFRTLLTGRDLEQVLLRSLSFKAGKTPESEFHLFLTDLAHRQGLDPASYPNLARYTEYLVLFDTIDLAAVIEELELFEESLLDASITGPEDRELVQLERDWAALSAVLRGTATLDEYHALDREARGRLRDLPERLRRMAERHRVPLFGGGPRPELFEALPAALRFYRLAERRNEALVSNTLDRMRRSDSKAAALVTGGFHSEGISRILRQRRLSHLVILPRITDPNKKRPYLVILTRKPAEIARRLSSETGRYQIAIRSVFTAGRHNPLATDAELGQVLEPFVAELRKDADPGRRAAEWMDAYAAQYAREGGVSESLRPQRIRDILRRMTGYAQLDEEAVTEGARLATREDFDKVIRSLIAGDVVEKRSAVSIVERWAQTPRSQRDYIPDGSQAQALVEALAALAGPGEIVAARSALASLIGGHTASRRNIAVRDRFYALAADRVKVVWLQQVWDHAGQTPEDRDSYKVLVDPPLVEASAVLFDKGIGTFTSSANSRDQYDAAFIGIDTGSLTPDNQALLDPLASEGLYDKRGNKLVFKFDRDMSVQALDRLAVATVDRFLDQTGRLKVGDPVDDPYLRHGRGIVQGVDGRKVTVKFPLHAEPETFDVSLFAGARLALERPTVRVSAVTLEEFRDLLREGALDDLLFDRAYKMRAYGTPAPADDLRRTLVPYEAGNATHRLILDTMKTGLLHDLDSAIEGVTDNADLAGSALVYVMRDPRRARRGPIGYSIAVPLAAVDARSGYAFPEEYGPRPSETPSISPAYDRIAYQGPGREAMIIDVLIHPEYRGGSLGVKLRQRLLQQLSRQGVSVVRGQTWYPPFLDSRLMGYPVYVRDTLRYPGFKRPFYRYAIVLDAAAALARDLQGQPTFSMRDAKGLRSSGARLAAPGMIRVNVNGTALEVPARGILSYDPDQPINYRQLLHLVARSPLVTGYASGLSIESEDVYIERDEPVRGGRPGEVNTEVYVLSRSTDVKLSDKTIDTPEGEVAVNERTSFMEVRDGDVITIEPRKGRKPRERSVDLREYGRFEFVERDGSYTVRVISPGARLAISDFSQRGGRLHAVHRRLRDQMLVPYLVGSGVALPDAEIVANTFVRARQELLDYYRDTGLLTDEESAILAETFKTKTLDEGRLTLDRLDRLSLQDDALAARVRERLAGYAAYPEGQRKDLVERLVPAEDVRVWIDLGVPEWVVFAALRNRFNLVRDMDDALDFVRTHQERTGGAAIAWQYVLFYGLEEGERVFDAAAAWVETHTALMGGAVNAWKFLLAHNLETADAELGRSRAWVDAHQGRVGGPANAWQIVLSYGAKGAGAFLKKAEKWVAAHGADVGGVSNAWRIYTRQGAAAADAFVERGRAWVDANHENVHGRRNAWSILAAHGLDRADAVVAAGQAWVSAHAASVGGRRNAWDIFIKQGADGVAVWVEAHRASAQERITAGASPARAWFLEITNLTQLSGARLSALTERKSGHVVVLDREGDAPVMRVLPVVRASDLSRRERMAAFERFYDWFDDERAAVTHGADIEYYLQALERDDPAVLTRLFLVWSDEGIEGYADLGSEGRDFSGIETAPWNRRALGERARYGGMGAELRMFAIRRLESEWGADVLYGPKIHHVVTLGHRDSGGDVFDYATIDRAAVRAEMGRQAQVRRRLVREYGYAPVAAPGARLADGHRNIYYAVNLSDLGVEYDGKRVTTRQGLDKLRRMLPQLREAGFRKVYLYGGLYQPSPLSLQVHQVEHDGEHYLTSGAATVRVGGYRTRRDDADGILLRDTFGNPFSIQGMHRLNRELSSRRTQDTFAALAAEADALGIGIVADYIPWTSPDAIDDGNYRRYFWRPVPGENAERFMARGEVDKKRMLRGLLQGDDSRSFLIRADDAGTERPVFVKHLAFFGSHSADQAIPNALHPEVQHQMIESFRRLIDLGVREFRVDLGHLLLKKHLRGYFDQQRSHGVDLMPWLAESGVPVRPGEDFQTWWDRQEEPWRNVIASARSYAYERYGEPVRIYMETYDPSDQQDLLLLGADATYFGALFEAFYQVVKQGAPASVLEEALARAFALRSRIVTYLTNYDQISLRMIGDAPEAAAMILAMLSRWGVKVILDSRDHAFLKGQISTIPGGSHDPHDKHTHSRGDRRELEMRADFETYLRQLTVDTPLARVFADFERAVPEKSETYVTFLNNSNRDRYLTPAWRTETGDWIVALIDFRPGQRKTFVKVELPARLTGFDAEAYRAVDGLSGRVYEITAWEPDRPGSPPTVDVRFEPSESGLPYRLVRLEPKSGARLAQETDASADGYARLDPAQLAHMSPSPDFLEAVRYLNEELAGRPLDWPDILDLYEILRGDRRNPEYTPEVRAQRLNTIETLLPERDSILSVLGTRSADRRRVIDNAVILYREIANREIFTYARGYRFKGRSAIPDPAPLGLPGFDRVRALSDGSGAHPADGHHRLAWLVMNHYLIVNGLTPFYFRPGEYEDYYEDYSPRMAAMGVDLSELASDGRIRRVASPMRVGARLAVSSAALGRAPEDDLYADRYEALTRRFETAEGVPFEWSSPLGPVQAVIRYDGLFDVFVVRPSDATRKRYAQLDILDLSATQEDIGEKGSFGNIRVKLREIDGELSAVIDEIHPSRGYRKLGPSSVRRAFRPWAERAIDALTARMDEATGIKRLYASTPERIDARYARQSIPQANLWESYRYPFARKGWEITAVGLPGEPAARLWVRSDRSGARLADADALERLAVEPDVLRRMELTERLGWDLRPVEAALLDGLYVGHDMEIKKIVNPDDRPLVAVYGGSGSDISNFLLSTNATEGYFVDHAGLLPEAWLAALRQGPALADSFGWLEYRISKYTHGHAVTGRLGLDQPEAAILMELASIGVDLTRMDDVIDEGDGSFTVRFPWSYPGQSERMYRITFVNADITDPGSYPERLKKRLKQGIDLYYQRAGMLIPARYGDFMYTIARAVRPGGHLVTDDVLFNGHGYRFTDPGPGVASLGFRAGPDLNPPVLRRVSEAIVESRKRVLGAHLFSPFELHYGFDLTVRRRESSVRSVSGARLSEYAGPLSLERIRQVARYGFLTPVGPEDPARRAVLDLLRERIATLPSEVAVLSEALGKLGSTDWEAFPLIVVSVEHVTQRGGATDLAAVHERDTREGPRIGIAKEALYGLPAHLTAELALRAAASAEIEPDLLRRLFPENYPARAGRGELWARIEALAKRRVVPSGTEALIKRIEDFEIGIEKGTLKVDEKFPALVSSFARDVESLGTTSRYLRETVVQPFQKKVRGKRAGPEMSDVYAALRGIGLFDALMRDEIAAMRRDLFDADFASLAGRYRRLPLYMRMQLGERDESPEIYDKWFLEESEAYNAETREFLESLTEHVAWLEERVRSSIQALPNLSAAQLKAASQDGTPDTLGGLRRAAVALEDLADIRGALEPVSGIDGYRELVRGLDAALERSRILESAVRQAVSLKMGARLAGARQILYRHNDGVGITSTMAALHASGVLERLKEGPVSFGDLAAELEKHRGRLNRGYLHVALRILAAQGWVRREGRPGTDAMRIELTSNGRYALRYAEAYTRAAELLALSRRLDRLLFSGAGVAEPEDERLFADAVESSLRQWDLPQAADAQDEKVREEVLGHLDGVLTAPVMVELRQRDLAGTAVDLRHIEGNPAMLQAAYRLLQGQGFVELDGTAATWTDIGGIIAQTAWSYGVPVSYMPLFARTMDLLYGDPETVFSRDARGSETWVDRPLNVRASAGAHQNYFTSIDRVVMDLFNNPDLDAQPKGIADMGSGNGAFLLHLYEVVLKQTLRGKHLDTHPLLIVGADLNAEAREATHATLEAAGVPHQVVYGDINQPERYAEDLRAALGIEASDLLHVRSFIDHNRPYRTPRDASAAAVRQGRSTGAFAQLGRVIPNAELEQNLVEHLRAWQPLVSKHGLILLELHTLDPERTAQNRGRTLDLAYFATHGYSDQYLVEPEIFLAAAEEAGLTAQPVRQSRFPAGQLATVTVDYLKGEPQSRKAPTEFRVSGARLSWRSIKEFFVKAEQYFDYYRTLAVYSFTAKPGDRLRLRYIGHSPFNDDIANAILFFGRNSRYAVGVNRTDDTSYELLRLHGDQDVLTAQFEEGYDLISEVYPEIHFEPYWRRYVQGESQIRRLDKFILMDEAHRYTTRYHEVFPVPIERLRQNISALRKRAAEDPAAAQELSRLSEQERLYDRAKQNIQTLLDDRRIFTEEESARIRGGLIVMGVLTETQLIIPTLSVEYQFGLLRKSPARPLAYIPIRYYARIDRSTFHERWLAARVLLYALDHYERRQAYRDAGVVPETIHNRLREFDRRWFNSVPWRIRIDFFVRHVVTYLADSFKMMRLRRALRAEIRVFLKDLEELRIPALRPTGLSQTALIKERERSVVHFVQHDYDMRMRIVDLEKRADELAGRARALGAPHLALQVHRAANRLQSDLGVVDSGLIVMDRYVNFLKTLIRQGQFNEFTKALYDLRRGLLPLARGYKVALENSEKSLFLTLAGNIQFREWMIEMFDRQRIMNRSANRRTVVLAEAEAVRLYDDVVYRFEQARSGARLADPSDGPRTSAVRTDRLLAAEDYFTRQAADLLERVERVLAEDPDADADRLRRAQAHLVGLLRVLAGLERGAREDDAPEVFRAILQAWAVLVRLRSPDWDAHIGGFEAQAEEMGRELTAFIRSYGASHLGEDRRAALLATVSAAEAHRAMNLLRYYLPSNPELTDLQEALREILSRYRAVQMSASSGRAPAPDSADLEWIGRRVQEALAALEEQRTVGAVVRQRLGEPLGLSLRYLEEIAALRGPTPPTTVGARLAWHENTVSARIDAERARTHLTAAFVRHVRPRLRDRDDVLYAERLIDGYVEAARYLNTLMDRRLSADDLEREWRHMHRLAELGHYRSGRYAGWDEKGAALAHIRSLFRADFDALVARDPYLAAAMAFAGPANGQFFGDGNHRLGSLLMNYVLLKAGQPPFYLTADNYERYRQLASGVDVDRLAAFVREEAARGARLADAPDDDLGIEFGPDIRAVVYGDRTLELLTSTAPAAREALDRLIDAYLATQVSVYPSLPEFVEFMIAEREGLARDVFESYGALREELRGLFDQEESRMVLETPFLSFVPAGSTDLLSGFIAQKRGLSADVVRGLSLREVLPVVLGLAFERTAASSAEVRMRQRIIDGLPEIRREIESAFRAAHDLPEEQERRFLTLYGIHLRMSRIDDPADYLRRYIAGARLASQEDRGRLTQAVVADLTELRGFIVLNLDRDLILEGPDLRVTVLRPAEAVRRLDEALAALSSAQEDAARQAAVVRLTGLLQEWRYALASAPGTHAIVTEIQTAIRALSGLLEDPDSVPVPGVLLARVAERLAGLEALHERLQQAVDAEDPTGDGEASRIMLSLATSVQHLRWASGDPVHRLRPILRSTLRELASVTHPEMRTLYGDETFGILQVFRAELAVVSADLEPWIERFSDVTEEDLRNARRALSKIQMARDMINRLRLELDPELDRQLNGLALRLGLVIRRQGGLRREAEALYRDRALIERIVIGISDALSRHPSARDIPADVRQLLIGENYDSLRSAVDDLERVIVGARLAANGTRKAVDRRIRDGLNKLEKRYIDDPVSQAYPVTNRALFAATGSNHETFFAHVTEGSDLAATVERIRALAEAHRSEIEARQRSEAQTLVTIRTALERIEATAKEAPDALPVTLSNKWFYAQTGVSKYLFGRHVRSGTPEAEQVRRIREAHRAHRDKSFAAEADRRRLAERAVVRQALQGLIAAQADTSRRAGIIDIEHVARAADLDRHEVGRIIGGSTALKRLLNAHRTDRYDAAVLNAIRDLSRANRGALTDDNEFTEYTVASIARTAGVDESTVRSRLRGHERVRAEFLSVLPDLAGTTLDPAQLPGADALDAALVRRHELSATEARLLTHARRQWEAQLAAPQPTTVTAESVATAAGMAEKTGFARYRRIGPYFRTLSDNYLLAPRSVQVLRGIRSVLEAPPSGVRDEAGRWFITAVAAGAGVSVSTAEAELARPSLSAYADTARRRILSIVPRTQLSEAILSGRLDAGHQAELVRLLAAYHGNTEIAARLIGDGLGWRDLLRVGDYPAVRAYWEAHRDRNERYWLARVPDLVAIIALFEEVEEGGRVAFTDRFNEAYQEGDHPFPVDLWIVSLWASRIAELQPYDRSGSAGAGRAPLAIASDAEPDDADEAASGARLAASKLASIDWDGASPRPGSGALSVAMRSDEELRDLMLDWPVTFKARVRLNDDTRFYAWLFDEHLNTFEVGLTVVDARKGIVRLFEGHPEYADAAQSARVRPLAGPRIREWFRTQLPQKLRERGFRQLEVLLVDERAKTFFASLGFVINPEQIHADRESMLLDLTSEPPAPGARLALHLGPVPLGDLEKTIDEATAQLIAWSPGQQEIDFTFGAVGVGYVRVERGQPREPAGAYVLRGIRKNSGELSDRRFIVTIYGNRIYIDYDVPGRPNGDLTVGRDSDGARLAGPALGPRIVVGVRSEAARQVAREALGPRAGDIALVMSLPADLDDTEALALLEGTGADLALFYDGAEDPNKDAKADLLRALSGFVQRADRAAYPVLARLLSGELELSQVPVDERAGIERLIFSLLPVIRPVRIEDRLAGESEEALLELQLRLFHPSVGYTLEHLSGWTEPRAAVWSLETIAADPFFFRMLQDRDRKIAGRMPIVDYAAVPAGVDVAAVLGERYAEFTARFGAERVLTDTGSLESVDAALGAAASKEFGAAFTRERTLFVETERDAAARRAAVQGKDMPYLVVRGRIAPVLDKVVVEILAKAGSDQPLLVRGLTKIGDLYIYIPIVPVDFTKHFRRYYQMVRQVGAAA